MMDKKIAIEPNLTPVKEYLTQKGFDVDSVNLSESANKLQGYDAIVVSGMNTDFLGMEDTSTKAVVINAKGLTPEEVAKEIERS